MRYGLLGEKLGHSFSKEIHEKLGRYQYELIEVAPERLDGFMTRREFDGINVTIPYKQAVIPYLSEISDRARAIGAVNTIVNRDGELYGDNTDFGGLKALIERMELDLSGKKVLIAGTGGTSRTARAVALSYKNVELYRLSRHETQDSLTYKTAYEICSDADILINTTPAGMYPLMEDTPLSIEGFPNISGVVDVIYNPLTTKLVQQARERGVKAENGLYMLVAQAVLAAEIFTGERFADGTIDRIYREILLEKQNIVLTGMPSSGKTTLGRLLVKELGRELIDTDAVIVERAGAPITEIFKVHGEKFFRDLETRAIRDLSTTGGKIIATGGGAVLRKENVEALKMNGVVVFLDRPLEDLLPTGDRPLSDNAEKLRKLYAERYPVYTAAADAAIRVAGTPEETAKEILEKLQ